MFPSVKSSPTSERRQGARRQQSLRPAAGKKLEKLIELTSDKDKVRVGNRSMMKCANGVALVLAGAVVSYTKKKYGFRWDAVFLPKRT
jgi:hypothetical protein